MPKVYIDNKEYEVPAGKTMLEVCLSLGMNLTYFCWHPELHSVGACRQCAVINYRDENDTRGRITMACMLAAKDGTRISLSGEREKNFRKANIESLMINHPHDCPVCDEGGECHLQDMTVMSGHNYRRYRFKKRTHLNQDLGPFLYHEMNRCIQCYRCVRFYNDYAGGHDFGVFSAHDHVYFGRSEPGTLENEFSGNLVEICPTGVFTDKTFRRHYTRKWDLTNAPSVCHGCSLGCNILTGERYGIIRRVLTRFNGDVNGYFLCDKGRFGYEYTNSVDRIAHPLKKEGEEFHEITMEELAGDLKALTAPGKKMIGIGSPRASLESNFMLQELVGNENFYAGIPQAEGALVREIIHILKHGKVRTPSLGEVKKMDAVFVLGEDITNTASMLALNVRQSVKVQPNEVARKMGIPEWDDTATREVVQGDLGPMYLATTHATKLDEVAKDSYYAHPDNIARLGFAVAHEINNALPGVSGLGDHEKELAKKIAADLMSAKKPLVISGTSVYSKPVIEAASQVAHALKEKGKEEAGLFYIVNEANTMGLAMLSDQFLEAGLDRVAEGKTDTLLVLENNLAYRTGFDKVETLFRDAKHSIVLDSLRNETTALADYVLSAGAYTESTGTLVNNEGRAQRFYQVYAPKNDMKSSWEWLEAVMKLQADSEPEHFDAIVDRLIKKHPELELVKKTAPGADFRVGTQKIARATPRFSGRTANHANVTISEQKPEEDPNSPMSFTMEGYHGRMPATNTTYYRRPGWNSVQSINKYQIEVGGPLHDGNPGKRMLEPSGNGEAGYFDAIPSGFEAREGQWYVNPFYHIFGSDELTALSVAIRDRTPELYFALNSADARKCGAEKDGDMIELEVNNKKRRFKLKIDDTLPAGVAGLPKLKGSQGMQVPFWGNVRKG